MATHVFAATGHIDKVERSYIDQRIVITVGASQIAITDDELEEINHAVASLPAPMEATA